MVGEGVRVGVVLGVGDFVGVRVMVGVNVRVGVRVMVGVGVTVGVRVTVGVADAKTASTRLAFVSFAKNPTLHNSRPPTSISTNTDGLIAHPMSLGSFGA